jgi:hypothetical protein
VFLQRHPPRSFPSIGLSTVPTSFLLLPLQKVDLQVLLRLYLASPCFDIADWESPSLHRYYSPKTSSGDMERPSYRNHRPRLRISYIVLIVVMLPFPDFSEHILNNGVDQRNAMYVSDFAPVSRRLLLQIYASEVLFGLPPDSHQIGFCAPGFW